MSLPALNWHDVVGSVGVLLIVYAYFALQTGRWAAEWLRYSVVNLLGSVLIFLSLMWTFNFASVLIEIFWIAISLIGIGRWWRRHGRPGSI